MPRPSRTPTPFSLPPHLTQANTSKSNGLLSHSAKVHSRRSLLHPLRSGRGLLPRSRLLTCLGTRYGRSSAPTGDWCNYPVYQRVTVTCSVYGRTQVYTCGNPPYVQESYSHMTSSSGDVYVDVYREYRPSGYCNP